jgi:ribosomal protein S18 acetylase RimI-like enzyme
LADEILVYQEDGEIYSFITVKVDKIAGRGSLGLLAVDEKMRGKSIGRHMLNAAEDFFLNRGIKVIDVVTQKKNKAACALYESNRYRIKEIINIYHLWIR